VFRFVLVYDTCMNRGDLLDALDLHERAAAALAVAVRAFEVDGGWALDGSVSLAAWLREHGRLSHRDAKLLVDRGRFLDRFHVVADAAATRALSAGQIAALQHAVSVEVEPVLDDTAAELVSTLAPLTVADTVTACGLWRQRADALVDGPAPTVPEHSLSFHPVGGGGVTGTFTLHASGAAEFTAAVRTAVMTGDDDGRDRATSTADALVEICSFFNRNHQHPGTPRHHPHVGLSIDHTTLGGVIEAIDTDHRVVAHSVAEAMLCDSVINRVVRADGVPVDYGRRVYTVPKTLFRFVAARDGGCRYPGCDRPVRFCDAHHIHHWRHGGHTAGNNLVLLCNRHHHIVHQHHLDLKLLPNGEVHITWPNGHHHTSQPRGQPPHGP
jgi:hypothetical protein